MTFLCWNFDVQVSEEQKAALTRVFRSLTSSLCPNAPVDATTNKLTWFDLMLLRKFGPVSFVMLIVPRLLNILPHYPNIIKEKCG